MFRFWFLVWFWLSFGFSFGFDFGFGFGFDFDLKLVSFLIENSSFTRLLQGIPAFRDFRFRDPLYFVI